jgi:hypothetical protein
VLEKRTRKTEGERAVEEGALFSLVGMTSVRDPWCRTWGATGHVARPRVRARAWRRTGRHDSWPKIDEERQTCMSVQQFCETKTPHLEITKKY